MAMAAAAFASCANVPQSSPQTPAPVALRSAGGALPSTASTSAARPATAPTATPGPAAAAGPSEATLKLARSAGLKPEVQGGVTMFCWRDTDVGTRFATKKCVDENGLMMILDRRQEQRDSLLTVPCQGGCGGK